MHWIHDSITDFAEHVLKAKAKANAKLTRNANTVKCI